MLRIRGPGPSVGNLATLAPDDGRTPAVRPSPTAYWSQDQKWASLEGTFAGHLRALVDLLRTDYGWSVELDNAWRPWSTQPAYQKQAGSKTSVSLHNHVDARLRPNALAADLRVVRSVHGTLGEDDLATFFRDLREAADVFGLVCGGWYGVEEHDRAAPLGWDGPHVELSPYRSLGALRQTMTARYEAARVPIPGAVVAASGLDRAGTAEDVLLQVDCRSRPRRQD